MSEKSIDRKVGFKYHNLYKYSLKLFEGSSSRLLGSNTTAYKGEYLYRLYNLTWGLHMSFVCTRL